MIKKKVRHLNEGLTLLDSYNFRKVNNLKFLLNEESNLMNKSRNKINNASVLLDFNDPIFDSDDAFEELIMSDDGYEFDMIDELEEWEDCDEDYGEE